MAVYTLNPLHDSRWADFAERHPRASIFHTPGWLEVLRLTYGYEPIVYTTSAPGTPLVNGIVFCRVSSWLTGDRMVSLPFTDHCEPLVEGPEDGKEILDSLQGALGREKFKYIELRPLSANLLTETCLQKNNSFWFHALDLHAELGELFKKLQKDSIQRKIRRAEREDLLYEEGRSDSLLNKFYHLFMVYKYGGSDASSHNLGAMPFLFWKAIQDAKKDGVQRFDFGRSDSDNAGLITFKDRWGSQRSELTYWRLPGRSTQVPAPWKLKVAGPIFACMPDLFLAASGRILYRHLG